MSAEQMHSPAWHQLREQILAKAVVHGKVILSSGKEADYYVDLRRVTLDHAAAPLVGQVMRELTSDLAYQAAGGLTLGADPVATAMMHQAAAAGEVLDAFVVRKSEKAHGLQRRIEGPSVTGRAHRRRCPHRGRRHRCGLRRDRRSRRRCGHHRAWLCLSGGVLPGRPGPITAG